MLEDTLEMTARSVAEERFVYWAEAPAGRETVELPSEVVARDQTGRDLGERLGRVFGDLLGGPDDRVVAIGVDCPDLEPGIILEAYEALSASDLVLGPASDGGYYLLALRRMAPQLFEGVDWGTERVLEQTLERAKRAGLETALLGGLSDLDTPDDLVRFIARRALQAGAVGRHTEAALRSMGLLPSPA
jgi:rSAM/selenodomain-associated transferase 1